MAFTYGFYNSKNKDRRYNADQMSQLFDGILNDGVFNKVGELMMVVPGTGLQVLVKSGRAWFNSTWSYNDAAYPLNLSTPDVAVKRIDAVVLEVDHTESVRRNRLLVVKGLASSNPEKPTLTNTDLIHQHPLAYVTLNPGAESISAGDIEIMVGKDECPFVTGILQTASLEDLFESWDNQFTTWFDDIKSQLEGDVATNLLNEINKRVKIEDKASTSDVTAGTNDTKWVTPKGVAAIAGKVKDPSGNSYFTPTLMLDEVEIGDRIFNVTNAYPKLNNGQYVSLYIDSSKKLYMLFWANGSGKINPSSNYLGTITETSTITIPNLFYWYPSDTSNFVFGFYESRIIMIASYTFKKAIIYGSSNNHQIFGANSYYGIIDNNNLRYISSNISELGGNLAGASTIAHTMYNRGTYYIAGVYNNTVWVKQIYSSDQQQLLLHKFDINAKRFDGSVQTLDIGSHQSNISLSNFVWSARLGAVVDGKNSIMLTMFLYKQQVILGTKALSIDLGTGTTNWDSITNFVKFEGLSTYVLYIGSSSSYHFFLIPGYSGYAISSLLVKVNKSTLAVTTSTLKIRNSGSENAKREINVYNNKEGIRACQGLIADSLICVNPGIFIDVNTSEYIFTDYLTNADATLIRKANSVSNSDSLWIGQTLSYVEYDSSNNPSTFAKAYGGKYDFKMVKKV